MFRAIRRGLTFNRRATNSGSLCRRVVDPVNATNVQPLAAAIDSFPAAAGGALPPAPPPPTAASSGLRRMQTAAGRSVNINTAIALSSYANGGLPQRSGHRITGMLLVVSFSYIGCLLPLVVLSLVIHVAMLTDHHLAEKLFVALDDCQRVFEFISELNYAANFYIYVLSGAQFRHTLRHVLGRCSRLRRRSSRLRGGVVGGGHRYGDDIQPVVVPRPKPLVFGSGGSSSGGGAVAERHHNHQHQQKQWCRHSPRQNANVFHFRQFDVLPVAATSSR